MVLDGPDGPRLTAWYPTNIVRRSNEGEPFWTLVSGEVPADDEELVVHCFEHGHGVLRGSEIQDAISAYRSRGRTKRLVAETQRG
jgi:hypothetical protein